MDQIQTIHTEYCAEFFDLTLRNSGGICPHSADSGFLSVTNEDHSNQMNASTKRPLTALTLNARDPVPPPPGKEITRELRPPPKVYYPHRDCNGISPEKLEMMMQLRREYDEEMTSLQTENEIAKFEARQSGSYVDVIPDIPLPPTIDLDLLRGFDPPSATRFYDYNAPVTKPIELQRKRELKKFGKERSMHHGCPCCNPTHYGEFRKITKPPARNGRPLQRPRTNMQKRKPDIPLQMNQAYWNVLDEISIPARPKTTYVEYPKSSQFSMMRTGPRPGGIPILVDDLVASRKAGEKWFESQMAKKKDQELLQRERTLHERSIKSRVFNSSLREHTTEISLLSSQKWAVLATTKTSDIKKKKEKQPTKEELEALNELTKYDNKLYEEYQAKKRPTDEMELLLQKSALREYL